jgi:DNA-binding transcriptional LysR family regulator
MLIAMDHLRLRALALVEAIADTGSLHQAARHLNTSQPALSVMLQEVERSLGGRLFERSRRGLTPTEMGTYTIRQVRLILADLRRVQSEFASEREGRTLLRIGALPLVMLEIVPRALAILRERAPSVRIEFQEGAASELLGALADGSLDLVVGRMLPEFADNDDLDTSNLFSESFCIVAAAGHPLVRRRKVGWDELAAADWVESPPNTALRDNFVEAFLRHGAKPPQPLYQSASFYSCIAILKSSRCLMMVPREVGRHFSRETEIRMLPVEVGAASAPFALIRRRSRAVTQSQTAFEESLHQAVAVQRR